MATCLTGRRFNSGSARSRQRLERQHDGPRHTSAEPPGPGCQVPWGSGIFTVTENEVGLEVTITKGIPNQHGNDSAADESRNGAINSAETKNGELFELPNTDEATVEGTSTIAEQGDPKRTRSRNEDNREETFVSRQETWRETDQNSHRSEVSTLKPAQHAIKYRMWKTVAVFMCYFGQGLSNSLIGPTLVSLEYVLHTDTKTLAICFTSRSVGMLVGSLVCGLVTDRFNMELFLATASLLLGTLTIAAPFSGTVQGFIVAMTGEGFFYGILASSVQTYCLTLWDRAKHKRLILHTFHLVWSVGCVISPGIVNPFLPDLPSEDVLRNCSVVGRLENRTNLPTTAPVSTSQASRSSHPVSELLTGQPPLGHWSNITSPNPASNPLSSDSQGRPECNLDHINLVRLAYVAVPMTIIVASVMFLLIFCASRPTNCKAIEKETGNTDVRQTRAKWLKIKVLVFLFIFVFLYAWMSTVLNGLLATFVVKGLNWPNQRGSEIQIAYWGGTGIGRLLSIPLSLVMPSSAMIFCGIVTTISAYVLMLFVQLDEAVVWGSVLLAGVGVGGLLPSVILWSAEYVTFTGRANSVFMVGWACGWMSGPALGGYLFQTLGHMTLIYIVLSASLASLLFFFVTFIYAKYRKWGGHYSRPIADAPE